VTLLTVYCSLLEPSRLPSHAPPHHLPLQSFKNPSLFHKITNHNQRTIRLTPSFLLIHFTMAHLQSFMSDFLSQRGYSSIDVVSDNARIPRGQQEEQTSPPSSPPVSPRRHFDYIGTSRWVSVETTPPPFLGPPVRQASNGDLANYYAGESEISQQILNSRNQQHTTSLPKLPMRRGRF
jgi:hypothetical protein